MYLRDLLVSASAILLLVAGCGEGGPPTGNVTGAVTYKGKPLSEGTIAFLPNGGRPGYGRIVNGQIVEVFTHGTNDGAPVGLNQVTIQSHSGSGDMYAPTKSLIPERYGDPEKSGLSADIRKGTNQLTFDLE